MARKASVELELKAGQFKAEATVVEGKIEGVDRSVEKLDRSITKIPPDAAKAAAAMKLLGDESGKAKLKLDDFGKSSTSLGKLDQDLAKARVEVRRFAEEFNKTGSSGSLMGMFNAQSDVKELEKLKKRIVAGLEDAGLEGGKEFGKTFASSSQGFLSTPGVGPALVAGLVGVAVAAAPLIGAAINGALLAGVGAGGLAVGIAGQIHSPQVKAALADVGSELTNALHSTTAPFAQPLAASLHILGDAVSHLLGSIHFDKLADELVPFAAGIAKMVDKLGPGLSSALDASMPVLNALADLLPSVGKALSDMFSELAGSNSGAIEGLRTLLLGVVGLIEVLGHLIGFLSNVYHSFVSFGEAVTGVFASLAEGDRVLGPFADGLHNIFDAISNGSGDVTTLGKNLGDMGNNAGYVTDALRAMSAAFDEAFGKMMSVDEANLRLQQDLLGLKDAVDQHSHSIDGNSLAAAHNRELILGLIQDAENSRKAFIDQAGGANASQAAIDQANAAYAAARQRIIDMGVSAGLSRSQLEALVGQYDISIVYTETHYHVDRYSASVDQASYAAIPTGHIGGQRWGGIVSYAHGGLDPGIYPGRGDGIIKFAEAATKREAYIPENGDPARNMATLRTAASWMAMDVVPRRGGSGAGYADNRNVTYVINDATEPTKVVAAIKRYEQSNGAGWRR